MQITRYLGIGLLCLIAALPTIGAGNPVIFYTDLISGPNSGGESVSGFAGAYVTIYGQGFGASQGASTITLNGVSCLRTVSWGTSWLWYQKIVVQLGASCTTGNFSIVVGGLTSVEYPITLNAATYHPAPFTVRAANTRCVSTTGHDSNAGTFPTSCWATISQAAHTIGAGDIAYIENGVTASNQDPVAPFSAVISLTSGGTAGNPIALVAYPGATVTLNGGASLNGIRTPAVNGPGPFWVLAGFTISIPSATSAMSLTVGDMRLIANQMNCNAGTGLAACAEIEFQNIFFYGNTMSQAGNASSSKQYHGLYMSRETYHSDVGWNDIHNVQGRSAIIFGNDQNPPFDFWDIHVHDNVIHDVRGEAINFSTVDPDNGTVEAYNNVMWNVGTGPANIDGAPEFVAIRVWSKTTPVTVFTRIYNNTIYNAGGEHGPDSGALSLHDPAVVYNNLVFQLTSDAYLNSSGCNFRPASTKNDFFGNGAAPVCTNLTSNLNVNPQVVNATGFDFHLASSGSPMNGAGATGASVYDKDGLLRPNPPAIGAFEFATSQTDIYLAQSVAGAGNGVDCSTAKAVSFFNASANWGTTPGQIGSGITVHLCGVISSTLIVPASQGTGLITIKFEPGASMQQAAAQSFIQITGKTNSYLITGQTACGWQNRVFVACTESIKNTANGSPSSFPNSVTNITAIDTSNTTGSVTVQNLEIGPLYTHTDVNDSAFTNGAILANAFSADLMLGSLTTLNLYVHDTSFAYTMNPRQASATAVNGPPVLTIQHIEFFHNDHDIYLGPACNPACYSVEIGWIHSHDHTNWNTTSGAYHHDGIHIAGGQNTSSQTNIHNSLFDGPWNGNGTGPVFNQVAAQNLNVYNNVFICDPSQGCTVVPIAQWQYGGGPNQRFINNTIKATGLPSASNGAGILMNNPSANSTNVTHMNNIIDGATNEINFVNTVFASNTSTSGLDYNLYSNAITNGNRNFTWAGTATDSFTTWRSLSGEGTHSQFVGNGLLAADGTPQTGSPAIGTGTNLTSLCVGILTPLCTDFNGNPRPASGAWNVGAIGNPGTGTPLAALSQTSAAFFNQMAGTTTSLPIAVTLSNNGTASLNISSFTLTGTNPGDFAQTNNCGTGIASGTSCIINITFSPSVLGPRAAILNVNDNASGSPQTVTLSGNGFQRLAGSGILSGTGRLN